MRHNARPSGVKRVYMNGSGYNFDALRMLVCDDSRQIRSLITSFLSGFGIKSV